MISAAMAKAMSWLGRIWEQRWLGAGVVVVLATRLVGLPKTLWEYDEFLFAESILKFDPLNHHPHPPGYPLYVGMGKLVNVLVGDPFTSLVALALFSTLVAFGAFALAFAEIVRASRDRLGLVASNQDPAALQGVLASLLVFLAPASLVHTTLAMSDPPALMFLALTIWLAAKRGQVGEGRALLLGAVASAAVGCRPQLAVAVVPALLVALALTKGWRARLLAILGFVGVTIAWLTPLLSAVGGIARLVTYERAQALYAASHDADVSRGVRSAVDLFLRFVAHPWGNKFLSFPVLGLAAFGTVVLARRRVWCVLPLAILALANLAFCVIYMDPADGVRYALPSLPFVGLAAVVGAAASARGVKRHGESVLVLAVTAFGLGSLSYAWPVLTARRTTPSPPVQACAEINQKWPKQSVVLYDLSLRPHAEYLLRGFSLAPARLGWSSPPGGAGPAVLLLADGLDRTAGAAHFSWPASDAYGKLTRNHYRVVSVTPEQSRMMFEAVSGVSAEERDETGDAWRWLAPEAIVRVRDLGLGLARVHLELDRFAPFVTCRVAALVGGQEVVARDAARAMETVLDVPITGGGSVEITFQASQSYVPAELGLNRDRRRIAVKLLGLEQVLSSR